MVAVAPTVEIGPQAGPQEQFLSSPADIAIYGGAAGGGKTFALILETLRGIGDPLWKPVIFRRTCPQIIQANGLWDTASELYPKLGGTPRLTNLDWKFPCGEVIKFAHMEHEQDRFTWQGSAISLIAFDELTHFTARQFWYVWSRSRSVGTIAPYLRGTCNPEPGSWVASLLEWWIDPVSGFPIPERSGVIRYFIRDEDDSLLWGDTFDDPAFKGRRPISLTFIPAKLSDNRILTDKDPAYEDKLRSLPRAEREALLGGNWLSQESGVFDPSWFKERYIVLQDGSLQTMLKGEAVNIAPTELKRWAIIDTAGTSRERAEEDRGRDPSWSVMTIWDYARERNLLFLRSMMRIRAEYPELKERFSNHASLWNVRKVLIENAHFGPALAKEFKGPMIELIGPKISGMAENHRGAKLERAVASGCIQRAEDGLIRLPETNDPWIREYLNEHTAWKGRPTEPADAIDNTSYASWYAKKQQASQWGGPISTRR